jgi:Flp pilus assembly secretin CpaC
MKIGVIIVFHNNENDINTSFFIEQFKQTKNLQLCLVNNASTDKTYTILEDIKEMCETNVSVVDVKKFKSDQAAIKYGARFMFNQYNLNHVGYINVNKLNSQLLNINNLIEVISQNQDIIVKYNIEVLDKRELKQTLYQGLFSIIEYIEKLKINNQLLHYSVT